MNIRTRLLLSHAVMAIVVTVIAIAIVAILRIGTANMRELQRSYEQIRGINLIAIDANRYAEQVAELFILEDNADDADRARADMVAQLERLKALVREDGAEDGSAEIRQIDAMIRLAAALERADLRIRALLSEGREAAAREVFRDEIETRFDTALGALIEAATDRERVEVAAALDRSEDLTQRLRRMAIVVTGLAALLALLNALLVHRAIAYPVTALAEGADAVARGDLDHRVSVAGDDELGRLAARFNLMTTQIAEQRGRLEEAKADLERQVAERTQELEDRGTELERAVSRLSEVDATRAQFFADISHEMRTPLTVIRGHAEVTLRDPDATTERLRQTLSQVVRKADQMGRLVEDLLFLARSEAGAIAVERRRIDLHDVFADVLMDCQGLPRREGVTIHPHQTGDALVALGDADRLRQAILIPIDNAVRVAPEGSAVRVGLDRAGDAARLTVSDDGPGFTPEEAERAFLRFYRGGAARGRSGRGAGLGLSIAHWIVEQHGGRVAIDSTPGAGASVRIELPLAGEMA